MRAAEEGDRGGATAGDRHQRHRVRELPAQRQGQLPPCAYKMRLAEIPEERGRIIVAAHPVAFLGSEMFQADLVVIDESMLSHFVTHEQIEPELLLAPGIWVASGLGGGTTYKGTAQAVARALQERGKELVQPAGGRHRRRGPSA